MFVSVTTIHMHDTKQICKAFTATVCCDRYVIHSYCAHYIYVCVCVCVSVCVCVFVQE
jgi:hypothetical protein